VFNFKLEKDLNLNLFRPACMGALDCKFSLSDLRNKHYNLIKKCLILKVKKDLNLNIFDQLVWNLIV